MTTLEKQSIEEALSHLISGRADKAREILQGMLREQIPTQGGQATILYPEAKSIMNEFYPSDVA